MAKEKRNVWDELVELGRRIVNEIDEALIPAPKPPRKPARVPVPVRNKPHHPQRNPYDQD